MKIAEQAKAERELCAALGLPFVLRANQRIVRYSITEKSVMAVIEFYLTQETVRELRFIKKGTRMMVWSAVSPSDATLIGQSGQFWTYDEIMAYDTAFKPYTEHKIGRIETPAEYAERRRWEGDQYRVGSHKSPMDSAQRVCDGYSPMTDYWNK